MKSALRMAGLRTAPLGLVLLLGALMVSPGVRAEPISERELRAAVSAAAQRLRTDSAYLESMVNRGWQGLLDEQQLPLVAGMVRDVMAHEAMQAYVVNVLRPLVTDATTREMVTATMAEAMSALQVKGMRRLGTDQQAAFVRFTYDWAGWAPPKVCKAAFTGQLNTMQSMVLERRYAMTLPSQKFESYIALYKAATMAELDDYPSPRTVNSVQMKAAERAFTQAFLERTASMPAGLLERVIEAPDQVAAEDACSYFREVLAAVLSLEEPYRSWQLARFMADLH